MKMLLDVQVFLSAAQEVFKDSLRLHLVAEVENNYVVPLFSPTLFYGVDTNSRHAINVGNALDDVCRLSEKAHSFALSQANEVSSGDLNIRRVASFTRSASQKSKVSNVKPAVPMDFVFADRPGEVWMPGPSIVPTKVCFLLT